MDPRIISSINYQVYIFFMRIACEHDSNSRRESCSSFLRIIENEKLHTFILFRKTEEDVFLLLWRKHKLTIFILPLLGEVKNRYRSYDLIRVKAREEVHVTRKDFRWRNQPPHTSAPYWPIGLKNYRCSPMYRCFNITSPIPSYPPTFSPFLDHPSQVSPRLERIDRNLSELFRRILNYIKLNGKGIINLNRNEIVSSYIKI